MAIRRQAVNIGVSHATSFNPLTNFVACLGGAAFKD